MDMDFNQGMRIQFKMNALALALKGHRDAMPYNNGKFDVDKYLEDATKIFKFLEFELGAGHYQVVS